MFLTLDLHVWGRPGLSAPGPWLVAEDSGGAALSLCSVLGEEKGSQGHSFSSRSQHARKQGCGQGTGLCWELWGCVWTLLGGGCLWRCGP